MGFCTRSKNAEISVIQNAGAALELGLLQRYTEAGRILRRMIEKA